MKYARQTQGALDRLDQSLMRLRDLIKRGENQAAIQYMEEGELKERFGDLQNIITEMKEQSETENSYGNEIIIAAIGLGIAGIVIGAASFAKKK